MKAIFNEIFEAPRTTLFHYYHAGTMCLYPDYEEMLLSPLIELFDPLKSELTEPIRGE